MASSNLTNSQRNIRRAIDAATSTVLDYAAPEVPPMGNLTLEGLVEELGYINLARKSLEKTEKIIKERVKSLLDGKTEVRSDNFKMTYKAQERTALNQGKAKEYFEGLGILPEYLSTTEVLTMRVDEL